MRTEIETLKSLKFATEESKEEESSVMYYCDKCDFEYDDEDAIESHKELYHEFNFKICGEDFEDEYTLKTHKELHHANKYDKCNFESTSTKGSKIHKNAKHKEFATINPVEKYECDKCKLTFADVSDLKQHKNSIHRVLLTF